MDPKNLIKLLKKEFENNPKVIAFTLVGSQAREDVYKASQYSDMEAYVITKDEFAKEVEKDLPKVAEKLGRVLFSFRHAIGFIAVYEDLFRLELPVIKESGLDGLFNRPKAQVVKVLIDKTGGKLQKILDARPETIDFAEEFAKKVINFWHWQTIGALYFKKGELFNSRSITGIHSHFLVWLYELLNNPGILLLETNKRIETFLTKEQLKVLKGVISPYEESKVKDSLYKVMDIFPKIFKEVKEKYGYDYNASLEEKVKPRIIKLLQSK